MPEVTDRKRFVTEKLQAVFVLRQEESSSHLTNIRLNWAKEHKGWALDDWLHVIWKGRMKPHLKRVWTHVHARLQAAKIRQWGLDT